MLRFLFLIAIGLVVLSGCGKKPDATSGGDLPLDPKVAEQRKTSKKNMYEIITALVEGRNPGDFISAGIYETDGKKVGLSWRVAILPHLKEEELYKQFRLDEPWDSPSNKKLIAKMPSIFAAPSKSTGEGLTYYRAFTGKETMMPPAGSGVAGTVVKGIKWPDDIKDGTSNTGIIAEAAEPVIWTKPDDFEFDRSKPLPKLGGVFEDGFHIGFTSCEVRFFRNGTLTDEAFKAILTTNG